MEHVPGLLSDVAEVSLTLLIISTAEGYYANDYPDESSSAGDDEECGFSDDGDGSGDGDTGDGFTYKRRRRKTFEEDFRSIWSGDEGDADLGSEEDEDGDDVDSRWKAIRPSATRPPWLTSYS